ncbi:ER membrane protein complex subunit 6 [Hanseniaspora uvarum DSM 2768]|jgi:hypothetical protein|nr:ER membrane protein complex subunit 6 [Hanseniaspora uvarum DSM 2768]GMM40972.1 Emc6 protein [Hanseniaspora uvarum]
MNGGQDSMDLQFQQKNNTHNLVYNIEALKYIQDATSLIAGCCCGLLEFRNLAGLYFFLIQYFCVVAAFVVLYNGFNVKKLKAFFIAPFTNLIMDNLFREVASFTMAWILCNCIVS